MSDNLFTTSKLLLSAAIAAMATAVNMYIPIFVILFFSLITDYITGMVSAGMKGEISSKRGWNGIIKKLCYGIAVAIGFGVDYMVSYLAKTVGLQIAIPAFFGILVTVWLIMNEWVSILENLAEIGVPLPKFLLKALEVIGKVTEQAAEKGVGD
jgi:toxin secretion/phage lysis holin